MSPTWHVPSHLLRSRSLARIVVLCYAPLSGQNPANSPPPSAAPSMRTTGSVVGGGCWRRPQGCCGSLRGDTRQYGCCTFMLHVASSSRTQVVGRTCPDLERLI